MRGAHAHDSSFQSLGQASRVPSFLSLFPMQKGQVLVLIKNLEKVSLENDKIERGKFLTATESSFAFINLFA